MPDGPQRYTPTEIRGLSNREPLGSSGSPVQMAAFTNTSAALAGCHKCRFAADAYGPLPSERWAIMLRRIRRFFKHRRELRAFASADRALAELRNRNV